jgi:peptidyl-prolyl cis-trans isomerase B (cyclophilin B)
MARSQHVDSAGSQFFILHNDNNFLDGKYTVFGRLVPGLPHALDEIASLPTNERDQPLDASKATITKTQIIDGFVTSGFPDPERNISLVKKAKVDGGIVQTYHNTLHDVTFDLPYRWKAVEEEGKNLSLIVKPTPLEHNVQQMIDETGFTPQILIRGEPRNPSIESAGVSTAFFSLRSGDDPKILSNYIMTDPTTKAKAHFVISTQNLTTETETTKLKIAQIHFSNLNTNYSIVYINLEEWFRYEINAFDYTVKNFEIMIDGQMQPIEFGDNPVFAQIINTSREKHEPESLPPARIGGCLIATATFGSEMAPQVQFLREIRDNTVLQTESGTNFMAGFNQFYYSFSPAIADYERENPAFKEAVKITLTPLLTSLTLLQYVDIDSEYEMLGYGIAVILLNIGMYFIAPAVLITKIRSFYKLQ